jgi:hydrophobic/amphiphilic exporter-1 (mainly G- bacteria), HAE1 family
MNLSEIFIRRPVMTVLVMLAILLFGAMSYTLLPISALPSVEYPFIQVSASLPGATPEVMAASVAAPLERQFTEIAGLNSFNSSSSTGSTSISLQFDFSRRVDEAAKDVQAAISAAAGQLPTGMPKPPTYRKVNPSVAPILYLSHIPHFNFYDTYWSRRLDIFGTLQIVAHRLLRRKIRLFLCYFSEVRNVG